MKVLNVDLLHDGLTRNMNRMTRLEQEMTAILQSVEELVALDDALKGEGGQAIRDFYQYCHVPFLQYFLVFKQEFHAVLEQARHALASLESSDAGHMVETFLDGDVQEGLNRSANITRELTDEANAIMDSVSDIVGLPHLDDSRVQVSIIDAKRKRDETLEALYQFDQTQTNQLASIETSIQSMKEWVQNIEGMFTQGLTDVNFPSKQWSSMTVGSDITIKLNAMGLSVGRFLSPQEAAQLIEQSIKQKVIDDEDLDIAGAYYTLEDGRIVRAFYSPSGAVMYTFVKKIPKQKKVEKDVESESKWAGWISTTLDFIPGISNIKGIAEFAIGKDILTGREFSNVERGIVFAAIFGGPIAKGVTKGGKAVFSLGGKALDKMKNVLHPDKVKNLAKDVFEDYIKSPLNQVTTFAKDIGKKIGDLKTPFAYQVATPNGNMNVQKTVSEVVQDMKESTIQMSKKMDEKIGEKATGKSNLKIQFTKEQLATKPPYSPALDKWTKKGGTVKIDEDDTWVYTNKKGQTVRYPNGYPDFTEYAHPTVKPVEIEIASPTNRPLDNKNANKKAGLNKDSDPPVASLNEAPEGYTWHHHQDGKTMILVDKKVHREFTHAGGVSIVNGN